MHTSLRFQLAPAGTRPLNVEAPAELDLDFTLVVKLSQFVVELLLGREKATLRSRLLVNEWFTHFGYYVNDPIYWKHKNILQVVWIIFSNELKAQPEHGLVKISHREISAVQNKRHVR